MIITNPEVINYIEEFEVIKASSSLPEVELSTTDQKVLYTITEMFSIDKVFRSYISLLFIDFGEKIKTLEKEELTEALVKTIEFISNLNKKRGVNYEKKHKRNLNRKRWNV